MVYEFQLADGEIQILIMPSERLLVNLYAGHGDNADLIDSVVSNPIGPPQNDILKFAVRWQERTISGIACRGLMVFNRSPAFIESDTRYRPDHPRHVIDYTVENELAICNRRQSRDRLPTKLNRQNGGSDYLIRALKDELRQLEDLLCLVSQGADYHLPGIAARIRLLTADRPMGLLQRVASIAGLPLILFIEQPINKEKNKTITYWFNVSATVKSTSSHNTPIDLDVWLDCVAFHIDGDDKSLRELIKELGDTIGAHRDGDITIPVAAMMRRPSVSGRMYNDIRSVLAGLAELMIKLSQQLLQTMQIILNNNHCQG